MGHRRFLVSLLVAAACSLLLAGCSRGLDRETAEKVIRAGLASRTIEMEPANLEFRLDLNIESSGNDEDPDPSGLLKIYEGFVKMGVLKWAAQPHEYQDHYSKKWATEYKFNVVPQEGVQELGRAARIVAAVPSLKAVTGVAQEGKTAVVEAEFGLTPTPLFSKLKSGLADALARRKPERGSGVSWPNDSDLARTQKMSLQFRKYDDGWRWESE